METIEEVEKLEKIIGQLQAAHAEISILAKKSPSDSLNTFKLKMINKVIEGANEVLGKKYKPVEEFDKFEEDDLPSNSDVTMILAQYMEEAERYRSDNVMQELGRWYYVVDGKNSQIPSGMRSKVGEKMIDLTRATTEEAVAIYRATNNIFLGLLKEIRELSKKKPDAIMSAGKVKIINRVLEDLKRILDTEPEGKFLDILDDSNLPQTSDAVLVMVQYETALKSYKSKYYQSYKVDYERKASWVTPEFIKEYESYETEEDEEEDDH